MDPITYIQSLYEAARLRRKNGNEAMNITPYYYSIDEHNTVRSSDELLRVVRPDVRFYICCTVYTYREAPSYNPRDDIKAFGFLDGKCNIVNEICLNKWAITDINIFLKDMVERSSFVMVGDFKQKLDVCFEGASPLDMQLLWTLFSEIDANCSTIKEAMFYFNYYVNKLELDQVSYSLENYKSQLQESNDINKQYQNLLDKISILVND